MKNSATYSIENLRNEIIPTVEDMFKGDEEFGETIPEYLDWELRHIEEELADEGYTDSEVVNGLREDAEKAMAAADFEAFEVVMEDYIEWLEVAEREIAEWREREEMTEAERDWEIRCAMADWNY